MNFSNREKAEINKNMKKIISSGFKECQHNFSFDLRGGVACTQSPLSKFSGFPLIIIFMERTLYVNTFICNWELQGMNC